MDRASVYGTEGFWFEPRGVYSFQIFPRTSTPIFYAIFKQRSQNVKTLVAAGADINHPNSHGTTPALAACESNAESLLPLIQAGADPTRVDKAGRSLLNYWLTEE